METLLSAAISQLVMIEFHIISPMQHLRFEQHLVYVDIYLFASKMFILVIFHLRECSLFLSERLRFALVFCM